MGKYDRKEKLTFGKVTKRVLIAVFSTLLLVLILAWGVLFVLCKGPSEQAKRLFVLSTNETSGVYWMPNLVLSSEEVDSILHPAEENAAPAGDLQPAEEPDSFVELAWESEGHEEEIQPEVTDQLVTVGDFSGATAEELVSIIDIKGPNYVGKMMIILDPSKVVFGTLIITATIAAVCSLRNSSISITESPAPMQPDSKTPMEPVTVVFQTAW